jgi:hypothetical protein
MTAQISDTASYEGQVRAIVAVDGVGLFNPREHNVAPFSYSTACHRGYHCAYLVDEDSLYLTEIHIGLSRSDQRAAQLGRGPFLFGRIPRRYLVHGRRQDFVTGELERGRLLEARDLSAEAEALRARHPPRTNGFPQSEEHEIVRRWFHEHLRFRYGST